jgi:3-methyl-2-oxobutanoate hydroxymethyltransferase
MTALDNLLKSYRNGTALSCVTAYDASIAKYLETQGVNIVLVGDSLGQVIQGDKSTHNVSFEEIIYHAKCVTSGTNTATVMVDLPKNTYNTKLSALKNSKKLINNNLADLIKIEVDSDNLDIVKHLVQKNIPVCGHLGLLPQSVKSKSGFRKYGKNKIEASLIYNNAILLDTIGVKIILLECVEASLAKRIANSCCCPVIGIGSGLGLDGQVAVIYDLLGISFNKITSLTKKNEKVINKVIQAFIKKI